ncbi:MAG TPA: GTPase HflX [Candidatus Binatus sp.]|nr:GTPase HflX [Candidatus Binatus sp.]
MRALVVESKIPTVPSRAEECRSMAENIGYQVLDTIIQNRKSVHHSYILGPGKLEEVKQLIKEKAVKCVIFANTVSGARIFEVTRFLGGTDIKVIDRNLLILEVFEKRAMTKEAKLQIRLAKMRYTFSWGKEFLRMKGFTGEQVGWSGPGQYPYHEYEREARKRISRIEQELKDVYSKKQTLREHRRERGFPIVALAGYTQSGKTTFFNRVVSEKKDTGLGPFTTLSTYARKVWHDNGKLGKSEFILVDSIGFIEDMHPIILKAFNTTLGEISNSDLILLFVDVSEEHEAIFRKLTASNHILQKIAVDTSLIIVANKVDLLSPIQRDEARKLIARVFGGTIIVDASALKGDNIDKVLDLALKHLNASETTPEASTSGTVVATPSLEVLDRSQ